MVEFLHSDGTKEVRAGDDDAHRAVTSLGFPTFLANASYRRDNLAPLKILPTKLFGSISVIHVA